MIAERLEDPNVSSDAELWYDYAPEAPVRDFTSELMPQGPILEQEEPWHPTKTEPVIEEPLIEEKPKPKLSRIAAMSLGRSS